MKDEQILLLSQIHTHDFNAGVGEISEELIGCGKRNQILNPYANLKVFFGF